MPLEPAQKITTLKHLLAGRDTPWIATATGLSADEVDTIADDYGWPDRAKVQWGIDDLTSSLTAIPERRGPSGITHHRTAPAPAAANVTTTTPAAAAPPTLTLATEPAADAVRALLDLGATSEKARTRNLAAKIDELLTDLQARLDDEKAAREAAAAQAKAKAERDAEIAKLEARLAELKGAKAPGSPKVTQVADGPDAKTIRAWAAEHDVECPAVGRVPAKVREAYNAAHVEGAA